MEIVTAHDVDTPVVVINNNTTIDGIIRAIAINISSTQGNRQPVVKYTISTDTIGVVTCNESTVFKDRHELATAIIDGKLDLESLN